MNSEFLADTLTIVNKWYNTDNNREKLYIIDTLFSYIAENIDILKSDENLYSDFKEKAEYFLENLDTFKDENMSSLDIYIYERSLNSLKMFLEI
jgi:hypothetical protein